MQSAMLRLDALLRRRRRAVLALWAVVLLAALPFAARQSEDLSSGGFGVPGSQSAAVDAALERFPGAAGAPARRRADPARGRDGAAARGRDRRVGRRRAARSPTSRSRRRARRRCARPRPRPARVIVPLHAAVDEDDATAVAADLREGSRSPTARTPASRTHLVGQGALWAAMQDLSKEDLAKAESAGFPIVLLILLAVFGSLAAAPLPLALGFGSVLVTGALIFALSQVIEMSVFVTNMASMIGIGVAVDYSLFIVARYREEIAAGRPPEDARAVAMATSGVAVLFSGLTVIVSLAGLWMVDNTAIRSMALGAMLVVAVAVLGATTLLPALIGLLGRAAVALALVSFSLAAGVRAARRRSAASGSAGRTP